MTGQGFFQSEGEAGDAQLFLMVVSCAWHPDVSWCGGTGAWSE